MTCFLGVSTILVDIHVIIHTDLVVDEMNVKAIHSFTNSFVPQMSTYYVPSTVLNSEDIAISRRARKLMPSWTSYSSGKKIQ